LAVRAAVPGAVDGSGGLNLGIRCGDVIDDVLANRRRLRKHLPGEPCWLDQVHGTDVVLVERQDGGRLKVSGVEPRADAAVTVEPRADAAVTVEPGQVLAVLTADCLPVLFCDTAGRIVGAAHAGWRGLAAGVIEATVGRMRAAGGDEVELIAHLGPAIGPCAFEVGADVVAAFCEADAGAGNGVPADRRHGQVVRAICTPWRGVVCTHWASTGSRVGRCAPYPTRVVSTRIVAIGSPVGWSP
jgi:YfiH family protein